MARMRPMSAAEQLTSLRLDALVNEDPFWRTGLRESVAFFRSSQTVDAYSRLISALAEVHRSGLPADLSASGGTFPVCGNCWPALRRCPLGGTPLLITP